MQLPLPEKNIFSSILPQVDEGEILVAGLGKPEKPTGLLLLLCKPEESFNERHTAMTEILREPLTVALENDQRLQEMSALREAAEADKQSLLSRLGRKELGDTIVGVESGLHSVMQRAELVSRSDVPVLILGETGTGKELISRVIHNRSARAAGPFLRVNCGAIPTELIDSQLFGHERGSFTGAVEARKGWFERANGGTLFLDEIGELPPAAQVRLLRILQDGWLERVGGQKPIRVDVRIIAATHQDLAAMVSQKQFREDLWYRIAVFPILLPPLRDRLEDIPALARHFAGRAAIRFSLPPLMPTQSDIRLLREYKWPGNVRELGAVMDRAAILGDGKQLELAKSLGITPIAPVSSPSPTQSTPLTPSPNLAPLDQVIRLHIENALRTTSGRIEGTQGVAHLLQINPHTLRARMRKLGINWKTFRQDKSKIAS